MVINIMLSVNQAECDRTSERIKAVLDYKRSIREVTSGKCAEAVPSDNQIDRFFKNETYAGKDKVNLNYCEPYITLENLHSRNITITINMHYFRQSF